MPFHDLREFLAALEAAGDLVRVTRPVETRFEIAAGIRKMSDTGGPTLWFEDVTGHDMPVVGAVFTTRSTALLALGVDSAAEGNARFSHGLRNPVEPRLVPSGECQEVVHGLRHQPARAPHAGVLREGRGSVRNGGIRGEQGSDRPDSQRVGLSRHAHRQEPDVRYVACLSGSRYAHGSGRTAR